MGSNVKPKFKIGDKVFAKVRGYPPWPARIEGLADETPYNMRYHVYFYGTGETAVVKAKEVYPFVQHKSQYGKPKKFKNFAEAMRQIENELSPEERGLLSSSQDDDASESISTASDLDLSQNSSKTVAKPGVVVRKGDGDASKRPKTTDETEDSVAKRGKFNDDAEDSAELHSRSGRKIKPKKFTDAESVETEEEPTQPKSGKRKPEPAAPQEFLVAEHDQKIYQIPLLLNRPNTNQENLKFWDSMVMCQAEIIKAKIERDGPPADVHKIMDDWTKEKSTTYTNFRNSLAVKESLVKQEAQLMELDCSIRRSLTLEKADTAKCLEYLDTLLKLDLTALILKKHPEIVDTLKKTSKYVGNVCSWNMTKEEQAVFREDSREIRRKSELAFNKIKSLFAVPPGQRFLEIFESEVHAFVEKTKHLSSFDLYHMVEEPE